MSYTTRCPACGTTFRVVPDQLKISDGWVRCGHCADVFDATLYLQAWAPPPAAAVPEPEPVAEVPSPPAAGESDTTPPPDPRWGAFQPAPQPDAAPDALLPMGAVLDGDAVLGIPDGAVAGAEASPASSDTVPTDLPMPADGTPEPEIHIASGDVSPDSGARGACAAAEATPLDGRAPEAAPGALPDSASDVSLGVGETSPVEGSAAEVHASDFHAELFRFAEAAGRTVPEAADAPPAVSQTPASPGLHRTGEAETAVETIEPGFVRQARRQAFWRSPAIRAALAVLALLLGGLLGGQWAVHERDALAARHPQWTPLLTQLCEPLGCEVGPVRRIDAVVIDSSTLARRLGNFYAFDVVIKNTASIPVAVPALELSLTDTRDSVIARRVFLQSELPGAPALLPAQGSLPLSLRLSITDADAVPMAGYRALVFYP